MPKRSNNMSDTPQNDEAINEEVNVEVEINDSIPTSESGEQVQAESNEQVDEVDEVKVAQDKANAAFNKQYGEKKQLERDNAAQAQQLQQFQQAERERQAAQVGIIPPVPDAFDDNADELNRIRDEAITAQAVFNNNQANHLQQEQFNQQQAVQANNIENHRIVQDHNARTVKLGIKAEEMQQAENAVLQYGLNPELLKHITTMEDSPLVYKHLAANPQDAYQLASMGFTPKSRQKLAH